MGADIKPDAGRGEENLAILIAPPGVGESQSPPEEVEVSYPSHISMENSTSLLPLLIPAALQGGSICSGWLEGDPVSASLGKDGHRLCCPDT